MHQIRVIDTLFKWGKLWLALLHNEWKTARVFYQCSQFHALTDKNQSIINWWLSSKNTKLYILITKRLAAFHSITVCIVYPYMYIWELFSSLLYFTRAVNSCCKWAAQHSVKTKLFINTESIMSLQDNRQFIIKWWLSSHERIHWVLIRNTSLLQMRLQNTNFRYRKNSKLKYRDYNEKLTLEKFT